MSCYISVSLGYDFTASCCFAAINEQDLPKFENAYVIMACARSFFFLIVCLYIVGNGHFSSLNFTSSDFSSNGLQSYITDVCFFSGTTIIFQCEFHCLSRFFNAEEPLFYTYLL